MIKFKSDEKGTYAQWGTVGKKFYYPCGDIHSFNLSWSGVLPLIEVDCQIQHLLHLKY